MVSDVNMYDYVLLGNMYNTSENEYEPVRRLD